MSYVFLPDTITVSGYPPVIAMAMQANADGLSIKVTSGSHLTLFAAPASEQPMLRLAPKQVWCASCRALVPAASARDDLLGFRGYCANCVGILARRCEQQNGRLPVQGSEFFCVTCPPGDGIRPLAALCAPERDGRRRLRCKGCRLNQLRQRRRLRRLAAIADSRASTHNGRHR